MQPGGKSTSQAYLLCPAGAQVARVLAEKYRTYRAESIRSIPQRWKASIPWSPCLGPPRRQSTGKLKGRREQQGAAPSVPPCLPLLQSWSLTGAILLLLPPIYRDGRRRQVVAAVPSRPWCFPIPMSLSPFPSCQALPFPRAGCHVQLGHALGVTQRPPCRDPVPPGTWAQPGAAPWATSTSWQS